MNRSRGSIISILLYAVCFCAWGVSPGGATHWGPVHKLFRTIANEILTFASPVALNLTSKVSSQCVTSFLTVAVGLKDLQPWVIQMVDANGKLPTGLFRGTFVELGSYEQCLLITATNRMNETMFVGQHCTVTIEFPWNIIPNETNLRDVIGSSSALQQDLLDDPVVLNVIQGTFGVCVPSKCTAEDIHVLAHNLIQHLSMPLKALKVNCETRLQNVTWTAAKIGALSFFVVIAVFVLVGTVTDIALLSKKKAVGCTPYQSRLLRGILGFSFYSNAKKVAGTDSSTLQCLNGLRVLSLLWVILSHTYVLGLPHQFSINKNSVAYLRMSRNMSFSLLDNASPSVDTFFLLSGFLLTYTTWKVLESKKGKINLLKFLFRKYCRLTPSLCAAIALTLLLPMFSSGPLWKENTEMASKLCEKNWWRNLLYIQNFSFDEICIGPTWYIACWMQFSIIGILLTILTYRRKWLGLTAGFSLISIGVTLTIIFTGLYDLPPAPLYSSYGESRTLMHISYQLAKPHNHIGVYLIGMAVGYIVLKYTDIPIKKRYQILAWFSSTAVCLGVVFGAHYFRLTRERGTLAAGFYSSLHRNAWALGISWVVYSCTTGRAEIINSILSWYPFSFLAKLSYMTYLLHYHVITFYTARRRTNTYFSYDDITYEFIGHAFLAFIVSYFAHLTIEMPFSTLVNEFLQRKPPRRHRASIDRTNAKLPEQITTISFKVQQER